MIKRFKIGDIRFTFTIAKTTKVIGVNSNLEDGKHILMWDFDNVLLQDVEKALSSVQAGYALSEIYILRTKEPDNYIAYCFTACDWMKAVAIVAQTQFVDYQFLRFGVYRSHFTLRVTPKNERTPKLTKVLVGYQSPNCCIDDLKSWVRYETLMR